MEVEGEEEMCQNCHGPHNPTLTPCYIQPRGYFGQLQIGTGILNEKKWMYFPKIRINILQ
jgi:hypothetical protein